MIEPRTRRLFLAVALLTLAVYLVSARGLPTTFDEKVMLDTTASLAHGRADIDTPLPKIEASVLAAIDRSRRLG